MNDRLTSRYHESLALSVTRADPGAPTVIMFPGFTGLRLNATNRALTAKLEPYGIRCVVGDLSGHGDSGGTIRQQTIVKASYEINDVVDYVRDRYSVGRLGLLGNSFSGNAAILAAARVDDGLRALALKSPVTEYTEMRRSLLRDEGMRRWREQGWIELPDGTLSDYRFIEHADSVDTYRELAKITAPVLAIQGSADEEIPPSARRRLAREMTQHGKRYLLISGANHDLRDPHFGEVIEALADFLTDKLLQPSAAKVNVPC
ncbi:alpha/beta hydrolase [Actinomadura meridiana]|uniref:alpha/beta hydrolase n=1 Tax=Actinomadura meridiana TaxID=559626 RepID=UPI0031EBB33D